MGEVVTEMLSNEKFERYWPKISAELDTIPHIWAKWFTKEELRDDTLAGVYSVWASGTETQVFVIVFTRLIDYPCGRILQCFLALGNSLEDCLPSLSATLEKMANDLGCVECEIIGRRGWLKLLPEFKEQYVIMSKELKPFKVQ
jgi:hypothetical protein